MRGVAAMPISVDSSKALRDVDLKNAHFYFTLRIGRDCGIDENTLLPLADYVSRRDTFFLPEMVKALGFWSEDARSR